MMRANTWDTWFFSELTKKYGKSFLIQTVKPVLQIIESNPTEFHIKKNSNPFFLDAHKLNVFKAIDMLIDKLVNHTSDLHPFVVRFSLHL